MWNVNHCGQEVPTMEIEGFLLTMWNVNENTTVELSQPLKTVFY